MSLAPTAFLVLDKLIYLLFQLGFLPFLHYCNGCFAVLGLQARALCTVRKSFTTELFARSPCTIKNELFQKFSHTALLTESRRAELMKEHHIQTAIQHTAGMF